MNSNKNMSRIEKLTAEIHKAFSRIATEEELIRDLQQQLAEVENAEIIRLVRSQSLSPLALHQMLGEDPQNNNAVKARLPRVIKELKSSAVTPDAPEEVDE